MDEELFRKFGIALDLLEQVKNAANKDAGKLLASPLRELDGLYYDIKGESGYKDNSDEVA